MSELISDYYEHYGGKRKHKHRSNGEHSLFTLFIINNWGIMIMLILIIIAVVAFMAMWGRIKDKICNITIIGDALAPLIGCPEKEKGIVGGLVGGVGGVAKDLLGNIPIVGGLAGGIVGGVADSVGNILGGLTGGLL